MKNNRSLLIRYAGERRNGGDIAPYPFKRGAKWVEVPFHNNIIGNFMDYYQYRIETYYGNYSRMEKIQKGFL